MSNENTTTPATLETRSSTRFVKVNTIANDVVVVNPDTIARMSAFLKEAKTRGVPSTQYNVGVHFVDGRTLTIPTTATKADDALKSVARMLRASLCFSNVTESASA